MLKPNHILTYSACNVDTGDCPPRHTATLYANADGGHYSLCGGVAPILSLLFAGSEGHR